VRNEPDGTVRCELQGEPRQIDAFLDAVERAMDGHVQERVEVPTEDGAIPDEGVEVRR
jgi:acylphosphatase